VGGGGKERPGPEAFGRKTQTVHLPRIGREEGNASGAGGGYRGGEAPRSIQHTKVVRPKSGSKGRALSAHGRDICTERDTLKELMELSQYSYFHSDASSLAGVPGARRREEGSRALPSQHVEGMGAQRDGGDRAMVTLGLMKREDGRDGRGWKQDGDDGAGRRSAAIEEEDKGAVRKAIPDAGGSMPFEGGGGGSLRSGRDNFGPSPMVSSIERERIRELEKLSKFSYFESDGGGRGVGVGGAAASGAGSGRAGAGAQEGGKASWQEQLDQMIAQIKDRSLPSTSEGVGGLDGVPLPHLRAEYCRSQHAEDTNASSASRKNTIRQQSPLARGHRMLDIEEIYGEALIGTRREGGRAVEAPGERPLSSQRSGSRPRSSTREREVDADRRSGSRPRSSGRPPSAPKDRPLSAQGGRERNRDRERYGHRDATQEPSSAVITAQMLRMGPVYTPPQHVDHPSAQPITVGYSMAVRSAAIAAAQRGTRIRPESPQEDGDRPREPEAVGQNVGLQFESLGHSRGASRGVEEGSGSGGGWGEGGARAASPLHSTGAWDGGGTEKFGGISRDKSPHVDIARGGKREGGGERQGRLQSPDLNNLHSVSMYPSSGASSRSTAYPHVSPAHLRDRSPYANRQPSPYTSRHQCKTITGLKYGTARYPSPKYSRSSGGGSVGRSGMGREKHRDTQMSWDSSTVITSNQGHKHRNLTNVALSRLPGPLHTEGSLHVSPLVRHGAHDSGAHGGAGVSLDALMRDLEASRRRAEIARQEILARKAQWESDFMR
jgi:hypothetical protein